MSVLADLQHWYEAQCNDDWEHQFGVTIDTLDNPGWAVTIDLDDTNLAGVAFQEVKDIEHERDWISCWVEGDKFKGAGGPLKLEEILRIFLNWASSV
jgi:hypothetical protein